MVQVHFGVKRDGRVEGIQIRFQIRPSRQSGLGEIRVGIDSLYERSFLFVSAQGLIPLRL